MDPRSPEPADRPSGDHAAPTFDWVTLAGRSPLLAALLHLPLKKLTIWAGFLLLLFILRDFFPVIFLTFVLSYISSTLVQRIETKFSRRWVPVTLFFVALIGVLAFLLSVTIPMIQREAKEAQREIKLHSSWNAYVDDKLRDALGAEPYAGWADAIGEPAEPPDPTQLLRHVPLMGQVGAVTSASKSLSKGLVHVSPEDRKQYIDRATTVVKSIWKGVVYLFLSIIFSYMLVLTLPTFSQGLRSFEQSRLSDAYHEVAPSIEQFARLMGRAFEAQTVIALMNTLITAIGMQILGIPQKGLLSVGVFVCSFIPVAGVFISTAPIAVVGLLMPDGGFPKLP